MELKQLIADTASQYAELTQKIEADKQKAKFLKSKITKLQRELTRQEKIIQELDASR